MKIRELGLAGRADLPRLRIYTSEHGHSSIDKAAVVLGLNEALLQGINRSGQAFLSHTKLSGRYVLRLVISQLRTEETHVRQVWQLAQRTLQTLQEK